MASSIEHARGCGHRHGAQHVRTAGLVAVGRPAQFTSSTSPGRPFRRRGTPALPRGTPRAARRARRRQRAHTSCAPRTRRSRDAPDRRRFDVDAPVRHKLRGIHEDARADSVRLPREAVDRRRKAGHIRGAGHGQQRDAPAIAPEQVIDVVLVEAAVRKTRRGHSARRATADRSSDAPSPSSR